MTPQRHHLGDGEDEIEKQFDKRYTLIFGRNNGRGRHSMTPSTTIRQYNL
jgi:hypothetical protein